MQVRLGVYLAVVAWLCLLVSGQTTELYKTTPGTFPTKVPPSTPGKLPTKVPPTTPGTPTEVPPTTPGKIPTEAPPTTFGLLTTKVIPTTPAKLLTEAPPTTPKKLPTEAPPTTPHKLPTEALLTTPHKPPTEAPPTTPHKLPTEALLTTPHKPPTEAPPTTPQKLPTEALLTTPHKPPTEAPPTTPHKLPTEAPPTTPHKLTTEHPATTPKKLPTEAPPTTPQKTPTEAPPTTPSKPHIAWPKGTYALPTPETLCQYKHYYWWTGWRYHDTQDAIPNNQWSTPLHLLGPYYHNNMQQNFCVKTDYQTSEHDPEWEKGNYCIMKKGDSCPKDFDQGWIKWDDQNLFNKNKHGGVMPEGVYDHNTKIYYCCREDGNAATPIVLPSEEPFFLFRKHGKCQRVSDMTVNEEWFKWDGEDDLIDWTKYRWGSVPDLDSKGDNHKMMYCYYS